MGIFRAEVMSDANVSGIKSLKPKSLTSHKWQTGKRVDIVADKKRKALPAGKRRSKSGKIYYESRVNRSDIQGLDI